MNAKIQAQMVHRNPWEFRHIRNLEVRQNWLVGWRDLRRREISFCLVLQNYRDFRDVGQSVIFASPGMLQSGLSRWARLSVCHSCSLLRRLFSRELFDAWCEDKKNTILLTGTCASFCRCCAVVLPVFLRSLALDSVVSCAGYSVEGTLAHQLLSSPRVVEARDGRKLSLNATVEHVTFAGVLAFLFPDGTLVSMGSVFAFTAHADIVATSTFIDSLRPPNIILVHGEKNQMRRLHSVHLCSMLLLLVAPLFPLNCVCGYIFAALGWKIPSQGGLRGVHACEWANPRCSPGVSTKTPSTCHWGPGTTRTIIPSVSESCV
jgi:Cft2 family RNA processing exonuclease